MNFTTSTRCGLALTAVLTLLGCSSNSDNSNGGSGGAANGGAANGGTANVSGGAANGGTANVSGGANGGGSAGAAVGGRSATDGPASASREDIAAFLDKAGYKASPWVSDVSAPRKATSGSQHGDGIRVWENATLVTSIKAGRDGWMGRPAPDVGSMAVKEMYDDGGQLVGLAAALRTTATTGFDSWTYYCYAPGNRCSSSSASPTKEAPLYGNGAANATISCAICHNSTIFTVPP
jgi:hypothetical protein